MKNVVESDVANNQLSNEEAVSITNSIMVSVNKVSKRLGMVTPLFQSYRQLSNGNYEVQMLIGYNYEMVKNQILAEMKAQLQWESDEMRTKYERYLNPELQK
jgi:1-aminocyclopropane-1-carboxylate deaminase/D-cysteine desulfhydrase-like pyridoxal-dependent ACC family enzyme